MRRHLTPAETQKIHDQGYADATEALDDGYLGSPFGDWALYLIEGLGTEGAVRELLPPLPDETHLYEWIEEEGASLCASDLSRTIVFGLRGVPR